MGLITDKGQLQIPFKVSKKSLTLIEQGDFSELFKSVFMFLSKNIHANYELASVKGPYLLEGEKFEHIYILNFQKIEPFKCGS